MKFLAFLCPKPKSWFLPSSDLLCPGPGPHMLTGGYFLLPGAPAMMSPSSSSELVLPLARNSPTSFPFHLPHSGQTLTSLLHHSEGYCPGSLVVHPILREPVRCSHPVSQEPVLGSQLWPCLTCPEQGRAVGGCVSPAAGTYYLKCPVCTDFCNVKLGA